MAGAFDTLGGTQIKTGYPMAAPGKGFSTAMAASALKGVRENPFVRTRRSQITPRPFTRPPVARGNPV